MARLRHWELWKGHPHVRSGAQLTRGERAADIMKATLATWTALGIVLAFIFGWMVSNSYVRGGGHHFDPFPWILLNLCLSCFAALQCFVLLIANKRGEQIAAELATHTYENTTSLRQLLEENTELTRAIDQLTREMHEHLVPSSSPPPSPS